VSKPNKESRVSFRVVNSENWYAVSLLEVAPEQQEFLRESSYYMAECAYGGIWQPLAICIGEKIIGFIMWGYDTEEDSCWLGGIIIDRHHQGQGYDGEALSEVIELLSHEHGYSHFALSYKPTDIALKQLSSTLNFLETEELADDELVTRLRFSNSE